ncbi:MAG: AMP-binding protein, partial [Rhodothermales bacterium]
MSAIVEFDTITRLFLELCNRFRGTDRTALRYKSKESKQWEEILWDEFEELVRQMAGYLHRQDVRKGDRVAILAENRPEWAITDLATQLLGGVNVSLYTSLPADQVEYIVKDSGSKLLVVSTNLQQKKAEQIFDRCPDLKEIITMSELEDAARPYV